MNFKLLTGAPRFAVLIVLILAGVAPARAVTTRAIRDAGPELLRKGDLVSTALTGEGFVTPGFARETLGDSGAEMIWDFVREDSGALLCATGHRGRLVRLRDGAGAEIAAEVEEAELTAMLKLSGGDVLAAASPTGRIYRLDGDDELSTCTVLNAAFVWRLMLDGEDGVWAATGPEGKLFHIELLKNGAKVREVADLKSANLLDLWIDREGLMGRRDALLVAGQDPGWLYRVLPDGEGDPEVLYNAEAEEIRAIAPLNGELALALNTDRSPTSKAADLTFRMSGNAPSKSDPALSAMLKAGDGGPYGPSRSEIVALSPEGFRRQLYASDQRPIHALAAGPAGDDVLAAIGDDGLLMRIGARGDVTIVADAREDYLMRIKREDDHFLIGAARNGVMMSMDAKPRRKSEYLSRAIDAGAPVRWGHVWWRGLLDAGQTARIALRTGNDGDIEEGLWSEWTGLREIDNDTPAEAPGGAARYLQYRLELEGRAGGEAPRSEYVEAFYGEPNAAPMVMKVSAVESAGPQAGAKKKKSVPAGADATAGPVLAGGRKAHSNAMFIEVEWKAGDPNNDPLEYAVYFRASDETQWKLVADEVADSKLTISSGGVADGRYRFRVVASDARGTAPGEGLTNEAVSNELTIDNTPPVFGKMKIRVDDDAASVRFSVEDEVAMISSVRVDLNNGDVAELSPVNGLYDERREEFVYRSGSLEPGEYVATFNATDRRGNSAVSKALFTIE